MSVVDFLFVLAILGSAFLDGNRPDRNKQFIWWSLTTIAYRCLLFAGTIAVIGLVIFSQTTPSTPPSPSSSGLTLTVVLVAGTVSWLFEEILNAISGMLKK